MKFEKEILEAVKNPKGFVGFYVRRTFYFAEKELIIVVFKEIK